MSTFLKTLPWVLLASLPLPAETPALEAVLRAELAFAHLAGQQGIRPAFLACLTEDALVFTPRMIRAKEQYGPEPGDPGHLAWYPEAMGLSRSEDLAWSFGPWTYAAKKGGPVQAQGHFLSLWRKQVDGRWKVVADIGVPHPAPERSIPPFAAREARPAPPKPAPKEADAAAALRRQEADLAAAWVAKGGLALAPVLARKARILRRGSLPLQGEGVIRKALEADRPGPAWEVPRIQVASSGDLAWTCGETSKDVDGTAASFLRIWILESAVWKVLFDVRLPHPTPSE